MIYLAAPYSDPDVTVRRQRVALASMAAAALMEQGHVVFSPITHGHLIAKHLPDKHHSFWLRQCKPFLARASALDILTIEGWDRSTGIAVELQWAQFMQLPVRYIDIQGQEVKAA